MAAMRRLANINGQLAAAAGTAAHNSRSAVDNPKDEAHHLVLAHFDDYLRGEPGISHGAALPIVGGNPWRSRSHAQANAGIEARNGTSTPFALGSPWVFVYAGVMPPGSGVGLHTHTTCEEMFITLNNVCQFTHNNRTTQVAGACAVPVRCGETHGLHNPSATDETFFLDFNVSRVRDPHSRGQQGEATDLGDALANRSASLVSAEQLPIGRLDPTLLSPCASLLGGHGTVRFREVWGARDFSTNFTHLHHFSLPPHTSVGCFCREAVEEVWFVLSGRGVARVGELELELAPRDFVFVAAGRAQGMRNQSESEPLELLSVGALLAESEWPHEPVSPKGQGEASILGVPM
eukprot:SAG11_NODE_257_length_11556_cov_8.547176_8_plen_349_part_00